jgi:hypothetical protein
MSEPLAPLALSTARRIVIRVEVGCALSIGSVRGGERRIVPILGGIVAGPQFSGQVLPGGTDTQLLRPDGVLEIDANSVIDLGAAGKVLVQNRALRRIAVNPVGVYFRGTFAFEAPPGKLGWLNGSIFIAAGSRVADHVELEVFELA